jgi:levansucrase
MTSHWTADQLQLIDASALPGTPLITAAPPLLPGFDLWDMWPLQHRDGRVADFNGSHLWMSLAAPIMGDPVLRHGVARIRLLREQQGVWQDLGYVLPDGFSPGSREWSGSAIYDPATSNVTLFFTSAGYRGEAKLSYGQRLFQTTATLGDDLRLSGWSPLVESLRNDGTYSDTSQCEDLGPGTIKAFRDPGFFQDPKDGAAYLLFAASRAASTSAHNGVVAIARADDATLARWTLLPTLLCADGLNNELERPQIIYKQGHYYLFWSTQTHVFAPDGPRGPTGLYGMVSDTVLGPYVPLNGSGLVLCNPAAEPLQAFAWHVLDDLSVISFIDAWGLKGRKISDATMARAHFGGTPAPRLQLRLDGARATLATSAKL